ncbi:hypothetical protein HELRODRAFT_181258 [Helobdella robusta]|uniref:Uncharacterized protein n=1 Tax=Helobdella robusta TaxID=6412 RepID=T1FGT2_HELRO|nr:hypothetical protein HELRODRAFT_181258 [Helobdella robusta]ESN93150.1 hypothetical protein HELRODRAFT_181258 [Helobdella robusta]
MNLKQKQPPPLPMQPPPQMLPTTARSPSDTNDNEINDNNAANTSNDEFSTCFKSTFAYAGHSSRRLFKLSRGFNLPKRNLLPRMKNSPRGVRYKGSNLRKDSSPTISLGNMKETGAIITNEITGSREQNVKDIKKPGKGKNLARIGWKNTKCCIRKCGRCKSVCFKIFLIIVNFVFMLYINVYKSLDGGVGVK